VGDSTMIPIPPGYSYPKTAGLFALGAALTAVFSGSLAAIAPGAGRAEVLAVGMVVPSFTWLVQLAASGLRMDGRRRRLYWGDLGRACALGSAALLPAAALNLLAPGPPPWASAANVLASVALMAWDLFRRSSRNGTPRGWPIGWCLTIALNMALFLWVSRGWWGHTA
jgi:hypothetical protein